MARPKGDTMKRKRMSKSASKRKFRKGSKVNRRNLTSGRVKRGGERM